MRIFAVEANKNYLFRKISFQEKPGNTVEKIFIFVKIWDTSPSSNGDEK
jgi:hypothetical protein